MNYNDKKKYYFIQFDDRITDDIHILGLKKMPGGKAVIYTYLEMLVLAGETKGVIQRNDMFSTIADQIALQLKGISPEEVNTVFAVFTKCGYIAISDDGQSCTFKQAPILTSSQKGGTRRKKLAAIRKDALGTLPPPDDDTGLIADTKNAEEEEKPFLRAKKWSHIRAKNAPTSSSMKHCSEVLDSVMANNAARHHDDDALYTKKQHHHISTDLEDKRTRLIEWGISSFVAGQIVAMTHIQDMSLERLDAIHQIAQSKATNNPPGYLAALLKDQTFKLPKEIEIPKKQKIYNPDCPHCHGTGKCKASISTPDYDYEEELMVSCDCWEHYQKGGK